MELQLFLTLLLVLVSWILAQDLEDRGFFGWWTLGWAAMLAQLALGGVYLGGAAADLGGEPGAAVVFSLISVFGLLQVAFFLVGGRRLRLGRPVSRERTTKALVAAGLLGAAFGVAGTASLSDLPLAQSLQMGARNLGLAVAFPYCAFAFYRSGRYRWGPAAWCVVAGFLLYGANQAVYGIGALRDLAAALGGVDLPGPGIDVMFSDRAFVADVAWEAVIGTGTVLLLRREQRHAREALSASEERYRKLFEHSVDGIFLAEPSLRILDVNPSLREMLGRDGEEAGEAGLRLPDLLAPDARDDPPDLAAVRQGEVASLETSFARRDGTTFPVEMSLAFYELGDRQVLQGIVRDITARKALQDRLAHQALHHPLTDLPNRYRFREEMESALARMRRSREPFGLLFIDVDGLKEVNDVHGHPVGDALLEAVGRRLRRAVRDADSAAHVGGDEFTVLLHGCDDEEKLREAARRVRSSVDGPCDAGDGRVEIRVSVGGTLARADDAPDDVLTRADDAMYRAKAAGGSDGIALEVPDAG